jgi:hypothetical protein
MSETSRTKQSLTQIHIEVATHYLMYQHIHLITWIVALLVLQCILKILFWHKALYFCIFPMKEHIYHECFLIKLHANFGIFFVCSCSCTWVNLQDNIASLTANWCFAWQLQYECGVLIINYMQWLFVHHRIPTFSWFQAIPR